MISSSLSSSLPITKDKFESSIWHSLTRTQYLWSCPSFHFSCPWLLQNIAFTTSSTQLILNNALHWLNSFWYCCCLYLFNVFIGNPQTILSKSIAINNSSLKKKKKHLLLAVFVRLIVHLLPATSTHQFICSFMIWIPQTKQDKNVWYRTKSFKPRWTLMYSCLGVEHWQGDISWSDSLNDHWSQDYPNSCLLVAIPSF